MPFPHALVLRFTVHDINDLKSAVELLSPIAEYFDYSVQQAINRGHIGEHEWVLEGGSVRLYTSGTVSTDYWSQVVMRVIQQLKPMVKVGSYAEFTDYDSNSGDHTVRVDFNSVSDLDAEFDNDLRGVMLVLSKYFQTSSLEPLSNELRRQRYALMTSTKPSGKPLSLTKENQHGANAL